MGHLYSFERYSGQRCYYLNLAVRNLPGYLKNFPFDLIIFHTTFLSTRWHLPTFKQALSKIYVLRNHAAVKIALPQDEFIQMDVICDFINKFGIRHVFSVSPPSEWPKIYRTVDSRKVKFYQVLTGYLDDETVTRIERLAKSVPERTIDIGYRAWRAGQWLGRHGFLKTQIADIFQQKASNKNLTIDISTRSEDTFSGDNWYRFLLRCKYTIGVEGGASLLDWDGTIRKKTHNYMALHPHANFEDVERSCFHDLDGSLNLIVLSPRHLEACATRTCQVLIEGNYNGVLTANRHYIALRRDFSNIDEVLSMIINGSYYTDIVDQAYQDVVGSGLYTYREFVRVVLERSLPESASVYPQTILKNFVFLKVRLCDYMAWKRVRLRLKFMPLRQILLLVLPRSFKAKIKQWRTVSKDLIDNKSK